VDLQRGQRRIEPVRIYYITQAKLRRDVCDFYKPEDAAAFQLSEILENQMREEFEFMGRRCDLFTAAESGAGYARLQGRRVRPLYCNAAHLLESVVPSQETGKHGERRRSYANGKEFLSHWRREQNHGAEAVRLRYWETEFPMLQR